MGSASINRELNNLKQQQQQQQNDKNLMKNYLIGH